MQVRLPLLIFPLFRLSRRQMVLFGAFAVAWERGYYNPHTRQYLRFDGAPSPFLGIPEAM